MVTTASAPLQLHWPPTPARRFTVEEYHRVTECGAIPADERVELIDGWIVPVMTAGPRHETIVAHLNRLLQAFPEPEWSVRIQATLDLGDSEPCPDCVLVTGPTRRYYSARPRADEVHLLIEVSDSSLQYDREVKGRLYARNGIQRYMIVNVWDGQIELYTDPRPAGYARQLIFRRGETLVLQIGAQRFEVAVNELILHPAG